MFIFTWLTLCVGEKTKKNEKKWRENDAVAHVVHSFMSIKKKTESDQDTRRGSNYGEENDSAQERKKKSSNLFCWLWFRVALFKCI